MATATYALHQLAPLLGLDEPLTLHYIDIVQQHGYSFDEQKQFSLEDVELLQMILRLEREHGFSVDKAITLALSPDFDLTALQMPEKRLELLPDTEERFHHLTHSMELLANHLMNVERQNEQLLQVIAAQQQQHDTLVAQNKALAVKVDEVLQAVDTTEQKKHARQLERLESQNTAVMNLLNRVNTQLHDQEVAKHEEQKHVEEKSFFQKLFSK